MKFNLSYFGYQIDKLFSKSPFYRPAYQTQFIGRKGAVWLDVSDKRMIYESIPQLKIVIERKSAMFSNMNLKLVEVETGNVVEDEALMKLLEQPNLMQSQNEWLSQYKKQESVYGNQFMYKNQMSLANYPSSLINISPRFVQPFTTGKFFDQLEMNGIIEKYQFKQDGIVQRNFEPESVMWSRVTDLDSILSGTSPIDSLRYPISNIKGAYEYRNVIITEKGAIGILSNETKDQVGAMPLKKDEKKKIEEEYLNQYGVGYDQRRVILTEASLKWQPMTYPTKDLMLFEEIDENFKAIVDMYGMNINVFSNKNATFENVKQSLIGIYENTIQPEADLFAQKLSDFIEVPEGTKLVASYDHLKVLQEDQNQNADVLTKRVNAVNTMVTNGMIDPSTALNILAEELGIKEEDIQLIQSSLSNTAE